MCEIFRKKLRSMERVAAADRPGLLHLLYTLRLDGIGLHHVGKVCRHIEMDELWDIERAGPITVVVLVIEQRRRDSTGSDLEGEVLQ